MIEENNIENLKLEIENLRKQGDEYLNGWKRAKADYLNLKKEMEVQNKEIKEWMSKIMLIPLLIILDGFDKAFGEIPENLKIYRAKINAEWASFLVREKLALSRSEAKRLIENGGLDFNGRKIARASEQISESGTVKIGKHKFIKIDVRV